MFPRFLVAESASSSSSFLQLLPHCPPPQMFFLSLFCDEEEPFLFFFLRAFFPRALPSHFGFPAFSFPPAVCIRLFFLSNFLFSYDIFTMSFFSVLSVDFYCQYFLSSVWSLFQNDFESVLRLIFAVVCIYSSFCLSLVDRHLFSTCLWFVAFTCCIIFILFFLFLRHLILIYSSSSSSYYFVIFFFVDVFILVTQKDNSQQFYAVFLFE